MELIKLILDLYIATMQSVQKMLIQVSSLVAYNLTTLHQLRFTACSAAIKHAKRNAVQINVNS